MSRRPQIRDAEKLQIDQVLKRSGDASQRGDLQEALRLAHQAWDLIPDPKFIPACIDQNPWAQSRMPIVMMRQGRSVILFHASQHRATISS